MINNNLISLKEYNNVHIYLRKVGLKLGYIYKFLEEGISYNEIECLNLVQIFRKYLNWLDNDIRDTWDLLNDSNIISNLTDDIVHRVNTESNYYLLMELKELKSKLDNILGTKLFYFFL